MVLITSIVGRGSTPFCLISAPDPVYVSPHLLLFMLGDGGGWAETKGDGRITLRNSCMKELHVWLAII